MADPSMSPDELWQAYDQNGAVHEPLPVSEMAAQAPQAAPESQADSEEQALARQAQQRRRGRRRRRAQVEPQPVPNMPVPNMALVQQKLACNQAELARIDAERRQGLFGMGQQEGPRLPLGLSLKSLVVGAAFGWFAGYWYFGKKRGA